MRVWLLGTGRGECLVALGVMGGGPEELPSGHHAADGLHYLFLRPGKEGVLCWSWESWALVIASSLLWHLRRFFITGKPVSSLTCEDT